MSAFSFPPPNDPGLPFPGASKYVAPNGATDGTAINNAITAMGVSGDLLLGPGLFVVDTPLIVPRNSNGFRIRGCGEGVTILQPTAAARRAIDFPYIADGDLYQNVEFCDFSIDANNLPIPTSNQSLVGNLINGSRPHRVSCNRIRFRRIRVDNLVTNATASGGQYQAFSLGSVQGGTTVAAGSNGVDVTTFAGAGVLNVATSAGFLAASQLVVDTSTGTAVLSYTGTVGGNSYTGVALVSGTGVLATGGRVMEATQNVLTNFLYEDLTVNGGNDGFVVVGDRASGVISGVNIFYDEINWIRCYHDGGIIPSAANTNVGGGQVGGSAFGGTVRWTDCIFKNALDVYEIDTPQVAEITRCNSTDARNAHFFVRNFNQPQYPASQKIVWDDCHARVINLVPQVGGPLSFGWQIQSTTTPIPQFGHAEILNSSYANHQTQFPGTGMALSLAGVPISKLTVKNFDAVMDRLADTTAPINTTMGLIEIQPTTNFICVLENISITVIGSTTNTGAFPSLVRIGTLTAGIDMQVDIDGIEFTNQYTGVTATAESCIQLGRAQTSSTYHGTIRRMKILPGWTGDTNPRMINVQSSASSNTIKGELLVADCDFQQLPAGVEIKAQLLADQAKIRSSGNKWRVFPKPPTTSFTGVFATTTFTNNVGNQYIGMDPATIHFANATGAGITAIAASKDNGATYQNVWEQASGAMSQDVLTPVDNGDFIRISFATTQPTATARFGRS